MRSLVVLGLVLVACKKEEPPPPAPPVSACSVESWVPQVIEVGKRAGEGKSVVTKEGCSLFDGKLLARGYPMAADDVKKALTVTADCLPVLKTQAGEFTFVKTGEGLQVSRVRGVTDEALLKQEQDATQMLDAAIIQAARCPRADRRLDDDADASVAMAYALSASALQQALVAADGKSAGPDAATSDALNKVCTNVKRPQVTAKTDAEAVKKTLDGKVDVEPFAAMAVLLASSFTVFGKAAANLKIDDAGLNHVRPAARAVLAAPPSTNLEGVCSVWTMAETVMQANASSKKLSPK